MDKVVITKRVGRLQAIEQVAVVGIGNHKN